MEVRKKATFLLVINNSIMYKFFKDFTNHRKKTNRVIVFGADLSPKFLNIGTTKEIFQQSGKQDSSNFDHV